MLATLPSASVPLEHAAKSTTSTSVVQPFSSQIGCSLYAIIPSRMKNLLCSVLAARFDYSKTSLQNVVQTILQTYLINLEILEEVRIANYINEIRNEQLTVPLRANFFNFSTPRKIQKLNNEQPPSLEFRNVGKANSLDNVLIPRNKRIYIRPISRGYEQRPSTKPDQSRGPMPIQSNQNPV